MSNFNALKESYIRCEDPASWDSAEFVLKFVSESKYGEQNKVYLLPLCAELQRQHFLFMLFFSVMLIWTFNYSNLVKLTLQRALL